MMKKSQLRSLPYVDALLGCYVVTLGAFTQGRGEHELARIHQNFC